MGLVRFFSWCAGEEVVEGFDGGDVFVEDGPAHVDEGGPDSEALCGIVDALGVGDSFGDHA